MDNKKEFQISVADVIGEDIKTGARLFTARTLINSNLKQDVANKEIKGGFRSKLQYEYDYDKKITGEMEDCQFREMILALVNGQEIKTRLEDFWIWEEKHEVADGKIKVKEKPIGKVVVENDESYYELTASEDNTVVVPFDDGTEVICSYQYNTSVETFDIDGDSFSKTIKVTYISRIFNQDGLYKIMQIEIPRFKIDGKIDINLTHDGASTSKLTGKALDYNGRYARVKVKRVDGTQVPVQMIACTPPEATLHTDESLLLEIIGIRGGMYGNIPVSLDDVTITSSDVAVCRVNTTTKAIEYTGTGSAVITVALRSNPSVKDIINVTCS